MVMSLTVLTTLLGAVILFAAMGSQLMLEATDVRQLRMTGAVWPILYRFYLFQFDLYF
jgi:hypothetical protein